MYRTEPDLTLVLPLYNEGSVLAANLDHILETLTHGGFRFEMVMVDDCSSDGSRSVAEAFVERNPKVARLVVHSVNTGRGGAVADGILAGRGTVAGYIDVDCEGSPRYLLNFLPDLLSGSRDVITGLRIYPFSLSTWIRALMSVSYRWLVRRFVGVAFRDRQTGYKFFRRDRILPLLAFVKRTDWFWDTEIMVIASLAGLSIEERPILFLRDRRKKSTVRLLRDSVRMISELVEFWRRLPELRRAIEAQVQERAGALPVLRTGGGRA